MIFYLLKHLAGVYLCIFWRNSIIWTKYGQNRRESNKISLNFDMLPWQPSPWQHSATLRINDTKTGRSMLSAHVSAPKLFTSFNTWHITCWIWMCCECRRYVIFSSFWPTFIVPRHVCDTGNRQKRLYFLKNASWFI